MPRARSECAKSVWKNQENATRGAALERKAVRARLRAARKISMYGQGGRWVYTVMRYLRERGEVTFTPTPVTAVELLPLPRGSRGKSTRREGARSRLGPSGNPGR